MADAAAPSVPETPTFERVPAAEGSLLRGWLAVAYPFHNAEKARRTIAAWAGATTNARIVWSLIVAAAIDVCSGYLGAAFTTRHRGG